MDGTLIEYFMNQGGPWAVLFVFMLIWVMRDNKEREKESRGREQKLYETIDDQNEIMKGFSSKYDIVITKLDDIEERLPQR